MASPKKDKKFRHSENAIRVGDGRTLCPPLLGGVLARYCPAIVASGSRLFAPCGTSALGFSVRTGRRLPELGPHRGRVTAVCAGPSRTDCADPVVTGTSSGEVKLWDSRGCSCLCTIEFGSAVQALRWTQPETILVVLGVAGGEASIERLEVPSLEGARRAGSIPLSAKCLGVFDALKDVTVLTDGKDLCILANGWETCRRYSHSHALTAVAIDPFRRYVVAGDEMGVVWTWWNVLDGDSANDSVPRVPARWHWHAHPVRALAHSGPVLLSGGDEGVLCIRGMEDESLRFIPRFSSGLRHITVAAGNKIICCSVEDNSLGLLDDIQGWARPRYFHGIDISVPSGRGSKEKAKQPQLKSKAFEMSAVMHPLASGGIAFSASGRRAQFFGNDGLPSQNRPVALTRGTTSNKDPLQRWEVQRIAFSCNASCIMTSERRISPALQRFDAESAYSCVLKWWQRSEGGQYILDSISNNPHSSEVTVALSHPMLEHYFATASLDGRFKLWDRLPVTSVIGADGQSAAPAECWQCVAVGSWRSQPVLSACFSVDGSALATGMPGFIVLSEAEGGAEMHVLPLSEVTDRPEQLFSAVACERFLLLASVRGNKTKQQELLCWDLVSLQVIARLDLSAALQGSASLGVRCAACAGVLRFLTFRRAEAEVMAWQLRLKDGEVTFEQEASVTLPHHHGILDAAFMGKGSAGRFFCWTSSLELWDVDLDETPTEGRGVREMEEEPEAAASRGGLAGLLSSRTSASSRPAGSASRLFEYPIRTTSAQQAGLVPRLVHRVVPPHVPSHMLPPPSVIFAGLMSVFAKPLDDATPSYTSSKPAEAPASSEGTTEEYSELDSLPPWIRSEAFGREARQSEFVDATWMEELVEGAEMPDEDEGEQ